MATAQQEHLKIEQLQHTSADDVEVIAGRERENLEGWIPELVGEDDLRERSGDWCQGLRGVLCGLHGLVVNAERRAGGRVDGRAAVAG